MLFTKQKMQRRKYTTDYLIHLSTIAAPTIRNPPWVKFQSARWAFIQSAPTRKRLDAAQRQRLAGFLHDLPIVLDHETAAQAWTVITHLAERFRLTGYDAAYLELAQRLSLPLATLDLELRTAATALNVPLLGKDA